MIQTTAVISKDSPRAARWREVFGSEGVPLVSPVAVRGQVLGMESERFYKLDAQALSPDQRRRLVAYLTGRFRLSEEEVLATLASEHGMPILASDVVVVMSPRLLFAKAESLPPITATLPPLEEAYVSTAD
jgi:hypothetical protein